MSATLSTARQGQHTISNIRGSRHVAPGQHAPVAPAAAPVTLLRRSVRPVRDGAPRVGSIVPLDSQHRASLRKPAAALGWDNSTRLVLSVERDRAVVREGKRTESHLTKVALDRTGRLQLPPNVTGALALLPGDQVVAVALPSERELVIHAAADVLQGLTGVLETPAADEPDATVQRVAGDRPASVRRAFRPET
jgi:hypothetical protein